MIRPELDAIDASAGDTQAPELQGLWSSVTSPFLVQNSRFLPPEDRWQGRTDNAHDDNCHWTTTEAASAQAAVPQSAPGGQQNQAVDGNTAPQGSPAPARSAPQQEALDIAALDRARNERLDQLYALKRSDRRRYQSREVQGEIEALEATKHDEELQHLRVRSSEKAKSK
jgi:hypothetical protein